jgi:LmbE family N-acetylglucosaminyl deacetylase
VIDGRRPRLAVVFAHPDDDAYTIGGTLARWGRGIETTIVLCARALSALGDIP